MSGALSDILVLDFTHMLSGPFGTMLLADLGAETIKIEPLDGENTRRLLAGDPENSIEGMGAYFLTLCRNKKSICLDLKSSRGLELFYRLVEQADIVVDNFSRGVTGRLKIDHATLSKINERIITCSVTGFGETGPDPDRPAFDLVAQAMGGGMSITGEENGRPIRAGIPIGDLGGGLFGAIGILSALHARSRTGRGQHIDISMLDGQISMLNYMATMHLLSGRNPIPMGNGHFVHVPYDSFRTKTHNIVIAVLSDSEWLRFLEIPAFNRLKALNISSQPERFANRQSINREIENILLEHDCDHWTELFRTNRIPCAPVNDFGRSLHDPQIRARDMIVTVAHPNGQRVEMPGNPVKLSETSRDMFTSPPLLGQHTDEVLSSRLGLTAGEIEQLKRNKAVA